VADVTHPIIGVDFLSHFCLLVDCRNNGLLDGVTLLSLLAQAASLLIPSVKTITSGTPVDSLLAEFPDLTHPAGVQREVRHNTTTPSITSELYQAHRSSAGHGDWHRTGSLSPMPSWMPCCGMAQLAAQRVPALPFYTSCPRRTMVGVHAATTEL
jgi:hypothetical protein